VESTRRRRRPLLAGSGDLEPAQSSMATSEETLASSHL